ncbi:hypothetical protein BGZ97_012936 [Linnemannia gamsii]|uniref:Uncharacterized protein n=1 Tax=Linnemannia gamsii TaxID=64522 RepID=A0A9P6QZZ6_9FUNG|nr:hypothetical protein BGZ97_012936 [Linnemannia gamsii]
MGRPTSRDFEDELVLKFKALFDKIVDGVNKENPSYPFDFERFVDSFNTDDYITKQVFEYLVKEAARNYRRSNPYDRIPPFPRPPTIHHTASSTAPPGGAGASSPYTSLSSSLSSLAFDNPLHHDRVHNDGSQSEGEPAGGTPSARGIGTSTGITSTPVTSLRGGLPRSLTPNSTAASGSTSRTGRFHRPWDQGSTGPDLEILTQMFNRSRERRRSRERAGAILGGSRQNPLLENDNSDDSDTSDDSIYESITHSRSIMATMHDLDPSPTHSPGRNTSQSTAGRQSNSVSFAQLYPPLSASPSSPTTFASPPSLHSPFSPSNYWDSSTAVRADRLQRMSRYVFDDSGMARLRQPGYGSSFRHNWRQHNRRLERSRASASLLSTLSDVGGGHPSSSSSASTLQPSTAMPPLTPSFDLPTTATSTSGTLDMTRSGRRLSEPLITGRPETTSSFAGTRTVRGIRDFVAAPTEDRYTSFAEASRRGRAALRSAVLALEDTSDSTRNIRDRHDPEGSTNAASTSSSDSTNTVRPISSASASSSALLAPVSSTSTPTSTSTSARAVLLVDNCELGETTSPSLGVAGPSDETTVASLSVARESAGRRRRRSSMTPTRPDSPYPTVDNVRADSPFPEVENNRDDTPFPGGRRVDSPYPEVTGDDL